METATLSPTVIRADLVERLIAADTAAGARVYDSREISADDPPADYPQIAVYSASLAQRRSTRGPSWTRDETVAVVGYVTATSDAELAEALDSLEDEILEALLTDEDWLAPFQAVESVDSQKSLSVLETRRRLGTVAIRMTLTYGQRYEPKSAPVDLHSVAITTDTTEPAGADVSEREIEVAHG